MPRTVSRRAFLQSAAILMAGAAVACTPAAPASPTSKPAQTQPTPAQTAPAQTTSAQPGAADKPAADKPATATVPAAAKSGAAPRGQIVMAQPADVTTLDPNVFATGVAVQVVTHIFDTLVERDPRTMELVGNLAESWEITDPTTYVFKLKKGVKFHNGTELTASDVKFSIDRIMDPALKSTLTIYVDPFIKSVDVVDPYTVRFVLKAPYAPWIRRVPTFHIVPEQYVKQVGNTEFAKKPVGSGPYKVVEWVKDDHLTMESFTDYHKGAPPIARAIIKPIPEASTRVSALLSGEVDIVDQLPTDTVDTIANSRDARVDKTEANSFVYLIMNSFEKPLSDARVRQAIQYAIDWDSIIAHVLNGYGTRTYIPATKLDFGYKEYGEEISKLGYKYDPAKAKQLLADAGYASGFTTTLDTSGGITNQGVEIAQTIAGQLGQVGIKVDIIASALSVYNDRIRGKEVKGMLISEVANPLFDPDHVMGVQFDPKRTSHFYNTPQLTELIAKGQAESNDAERIKIYREIMTLLMKEAPMAPAYTVVNVYGVRNTIEWKGRADRRLFLFEAALR